MLKRQGGLDFCVSPGNISLYLYPSQIVLFDHRLFLLQKYSYFLLKHIQATDLIDQNICIVNMIELGELRLSGNHTVTEYEMSGEPYSQKRGWIKHSNERIFQVMIFK